MSIFESIISAFINFKANKMRAGLSSLGIIIGVFSVVVLLSMGEGTRNVINKTVESIGANLILVLPGGTKQTDIRGNLGAKSSKDVLTMSESNLIAKLPYIKYVSPEFATKQQIIYGSENISVTLYGVVPDYLYVRNVKVAFGSFVTKEHIDNVGKVVVLGRNVAKNLFGQSNPIGKNIRVGNTMLRVVGVMEAKGEQGMLGNADDNVFVPLTTIQKRMFGTKYLSYIAVTAVTNDVLDSVKTNIENILLKHFKIKDINLANFTVTNSADLLESVNEIFDSFNIFLFCIALISLVVGGIGVMNILLVSVSERTREIGIRRAIGAKSKDIIIQFLIESIFMCLIGGLIGLFLSFLVVQSTKSIIEGDMKPWIIFLGVGFSVGVGVVFGILPAYKAAKLKPIDALRYE